MKHLLKLMDLSKEEISEVLALAAKLKEERKNGIAHPLLKNKKLGMIFQKSSTRTGFLLRSACMNLAEPLCF
ncbi:Putrescine carbamoyltransferase [bioreactor metagenome]|uniref:Putrescine carbamoyltransferase n=1 Tax=bioreactor metagenome TaxID=1076179 RepID=A0A645G5Z7_9ZZZZ